MKTFIFGCKILKTLAAITVTGRFIIIMKVYLTVAVDHQMLPTNIFILWLRESLRKCCVVIYQLNPFYANGRESACLFPLWNTVNFASVILGGVLQYFFRKLGTLTTSNARCLTERFCH